MTSVTGSSVTPIGVQSSVKPHPPFSPSPCDAPPPVPVWPGLVGRWPARPGPVTSSCPGLDGSQPLDGRPTLEGNTRGGEGVLLLPLCGLTSQEVSKLKQSRVSVLPLPLFEGNTVGGVKAVGTRVCVHHNHFGQVSVEVGQVLQKHKLVCVSGRAWTFEDRACLDVLSINVLGGVAVEVVHDEALRVQLGYHRLCHVGDFTSEEDDLIAAEEGVEEVVDARTLLESPAL